MTIKNLSELTAIEEKLDLLKDAPELTLAMIERGASSNTGGFALRFIPDPARITESEDWTYSELLYRIRQAANLLHAAGAAGDKAVSIILPNSPAYHTLLWGAQAT